MVLPNLSLVEMTRKRTRESLEHVLCDECPTCQGRGRVKTVETVCCEIMREIIRVNHLFSSEQFVVYASPAVAGLLNQRRIARFIARDRNVHQQTGSSQNRAVLQPRTV